MKLSIFQTWKSRDPDTFPPVYKKCQESWQRLHPDISYKIYDDEENQTIISQHFSGKLEEVYNLVKNPVEKADIIRCVILFLYGGLYVDMDFMALKSHEDLFNTHYGITVGSLDIDNKENSWYVANSIPNAWMMSKYTYEIFWLFVLDNMCEMAVTDITDIEVRTGPVLLKNCINQYVKFNDVNEAISSLKYMHTYITDASIIRHSKITVLDPIVIYPNSWPTEQWKPNQTFFLENDWESICSKFPDSIAFTYWSHNW